VLILCEYNIDALGGGGGKKKKKKKRKGKQRKKGESIAGEALVG